MQVDAKDVFGYSEVLPDMPLFLYSLLNGCKGLIFPGAICFHLVTVFGTSLYLVPMQYKVFVHHICIQSHIVEGFDKYS